MKKKILLILSMCLIMLGLAGCGEDPTKVDYNGYTYEQLKGACENTVTVLQEMSESEKASYLASGDEMLEHLVGRWDEAVKGAGDFVKLGEFTVEKSGKTLTCEQEIIFKDRPVLLTYVYTYHNMQLEDITVDAVQTLGEKMTNAALNTLMGMGVVFAVLILISLIISSFKYGLKRKGLRKQQPRRQKRLWQPFRPQWKKQLQHRTIWNWQQWLQRQSQHLPELLQTIL